MMIANTMALQTLKSPIPSPQTPFNPSRTMGRTNRQTQRRSLAVCAAAAANKSHQHDVVVVGGGIIGLSIARHLLLHSDLSVAVVDAAVLCFRATCAGQGYIWMAHFTPGSDTWELSKRSKQLWEELAESVERKGLNPLDELGWKKTGSLLIGRTSEELSMLEDRAELFSKAGLRAEYLSATYLLSKEPALEVGGKCGAAFLPDDCQLDAIRTVAFIEKALVIAAGAWTGSLMQNVVVEPDVIPNVPVKPRKGHLLVLENFNKIHLNHGLMEVGYIGHKIASRPSDVENELHSSSISMTATIDNMGNLLLGSIRQFVGFNREVDESIIKRIWDRADGKPVIGPVPGLSNVLLATGHEGSGLRMALGTAEMVGDMILDNPGKVNRAPFTMNGRFTS